MKLHTFTLGLFAAATLPTAGQAALIYGLTASNQLLSFDSDNPSAVRTIGVISAPGVVDIDVYPVNGLLYGLNAGGELFRISTTTAAATLVATPAVDIATVTDFDFNPAVDRLRIISSGSRNFRMVPDVNNSNLERQRTVQHQPGHGSRYSIGNGRCQRPDQHRRSSRA